MPENAITNESHSHLKLHAIQPMVNDQQYNGPKSLINGEIHDELPKKRSKLRMAMVLLALMLSVFIAALDQSIVATAIPTITATLDSASGYVWIGGAYLLANAASGPIWAKLSDIWGRKPILLTAVALFFGSSIICAKAVDMKMLIIGRAVQGTAGGGLGQLVIITICDIFSQRERGLYLALIEAVFAVAGSSGPVLGGTFTEKLSWRWCFWINLPIAGSAFILLFLFLDVHNPKTSAKDGLKAMDWGGSLSILGIALMLLLGLEFGGATFPWKSPQVICLLVFGAGMSGIFIFIEKRLARYPLIPLSLFKERSNVACLLVGFLQGMVYFATEYYLPLYFQSVRGASPLRSGILILPLISMEALTGIIAGVTIHKTGRYLELMYLGTIIATIGVSTFNLLDVKTTIAQIVGFQILAGFGAGLLFAAPLIALQACVSQSDTASATSTFSFTRNMATSISVVVGGVIFQNSMDVRVESLKLAPVNLPANITDLLSDGKAAANVHISGILTDPIQKIAVKAAFADSLKNMWIFYTCLAGLTFVASLFIKKQVLSKVHVETKTGLKADS
ncbi:major facilitator superfamily transporter [Phlyctema vagabunda]|uniref:Major facilitator superfamily transporter n=1 Tax=Phlyctema vagabunda TaxID=108571 RepID=A0ABR4P8V6_9HELO